MAGRGHRRGAAPSIDAAVAVLLASLLGFLALLAAAAPDGAQAKPRRGAAAAAHRLTSISSRRKTGHRHGGAGRRSGTAQPVTAAPQPAPTTPSASTTPPDRKPVAPAPAPKPPRAPKPAPSPTPEPSPTPTPAPEPAPSSPGSLLFSATHLRDFWLDQSAPGAIAEVPDPAGSGETVFRFTVGDNDETNISPNPRGELLSPRTIRPGDEIWWSGRFFLPADFPSPLPGWMNVMQGPYGEPFDGPPPWHLEVNGSHIQWTRNSTYRFDVPFQMPLVKESWVSVLVHERFASDGWIEMWVNGQPITFFGGGTYNPNGLAPTQRLAMATMDSSNDGSANSIYLQSYRKKGMVPTLTTYEGPLRIGTSRASVGG
jgi:Polysaccharide lyase